MSRCHKVQDHFIRKYLTTYWCILVALSHHSIYDLKCSCLHVLPQGSHFFQECNMKIVQSNNQPYCWLFSNSVILLNWIAYNRHIPVYSKYTVYLLVQYASWINVTRHCLNVDNRPKCHMSKHVLHMGTRLLVIRAILVFRTTAWLCCHSVKIASRLMTLKTWNGGPLIVDVL